MKIAFKFYSFSLLPFLLSLKHSLAYYLEVRADEVAVPIEEGRVACLAQAALQRGHGLQLAHGRHQQLELGRREDVGLRGHVHRHADAQPPLQRAGAVQQNLQWGGGV